MHHKVSHSLIRNTYNFQTLHQKQAKEAQRQADKMHADRNTPTSPVIMKFANSIQQLQSRMEGVENMVKAKGWQDSSAADKIAKGGYGLFNKNGQKRTGISKAKVALGSCLPQQDQGVLQAGKTENCSPIRKSQRLSEPKKYSEQSPIKIPPINLHAIPQNFHSSCHPAPALSVASTNTPGSSLKKMSKKYEQSRSFLELPHETDTSILNMKLSGSFMSLLKEDESADKMGDPRGLKKGQQMINNSVGNTATSPTNQLTLLSASPLEKILKNSKTLGYLHIKQTLNQFKAHYSSRNNRKGQSIQGFQLGRVLGKGKFGEVYLGRHIQTGFLVALKKVEKQKLRQFRMVRQFVEQVKLHSSLDHPTIVKFYALLQEKDAFYLVLEYINGGTLFDYQNQIGPLPPKQAVDFLRDIIDALVYLHEKSIAHRDIKPENVVLCNGIAKLCDFGWSTVVQDVRSTFCGTLDYAPPEIIQRKTYDCTVDLWCIGVLTYELFVGRAPFESESRAEVMSSIVNVDKVGIPQSQELPNDARQFIQALLQKDPAKRPKITHLYEFSLFEKSSPQGKRNERSGAK